MKALNLAFEVLRDPSSRQKYDAARARAASPIVLQAAEAVVQTAQQRAENYPKDWKGFEAFLDHLSNDFQQADYRPTKGAIVPLPSGGKSLSAWIFIIGGVVVGFYSFPIFQHILPAATWFIAGVICLAGGGWLGAFVHAIIADNMKQGSHPQAARPGSPVAQGGRTTVVECPACQQLLRVGAANGKIRVTCSKCRTVFEYQPTTIYSPSPHVK